MTEAELTSEAKAAIRSYMLKFVIPSSVVLTIISGVLGYMMSASAKFTAYADAYTEAAKAITKVAEDAGAAKGKAESSQSHALEAERVAEKTKDELLKIQSQINDILKGNYEGFARTLIEDERFRKIVGTLSDRQVRDLNARIDDVARAWKGGVLAGVVIKGGTVIASGDGISVDVTSGRVSFQNPKNLKIVPVISAMPFNNTFLTESCYVREIGQNYVGIWQGAQDTTGRNHPPQDCDLVILGLG